MKNRLPIYIILIISSSCSMTNHKLRSNNFEVIFEKIDDCTSSGATEWQIESGVIKGMGEAGYLGTKRSYRDFILTAEFRPSKDVNSGIFIRCPGNEGSALDCYEINIWDNHVNQEYRTGAIVTHGPPLAHINTIGKWNNYTIRAEGSLIEVWLNDELTAKLQDNKTSKGRILLQMSGSGTIEFRNIKIFRL